MRAGWPTPRTVSWWHDSDTDLIDHLTKVSPVDDATILQTVHTLVEEEHQLRTRLEAGEIGKDEEHARLGQLEQQLDQCWDLLRQRRARRLADQDPDQATPRPVADVEGYQQ
ncbi:MAG: hypothetical protein QOF82_773 [Frankiales bacterium]|jgi:hypothetical protein|nr:hypothetical protein [Frankiales bacterium]